MKFQALLNLAPGAQFTVNGDEVIWLDENIAKPSDEDIQAEADRLSAEYPLKELRRIRNQKLLECDWTATVDSPLTDEQKTAWLAYRQELRNITDTYNNLNNVVWPTPPAS